MKNHCPIRMLSTRYLVEEAISFIHQRKWLVETIPMVETRGVGCTDWLMPFMQDCAQFPDKMVVVFSSQNAVKWVKRAMDSMNLTFPPAIKTACVGIQTKAVAVEWLNASVFLVERDSISLLKQLTALLPKYAMPVYLCGNRRLDTIPCGLRAEGFSVKEHMVYQTILLPAKTEKEYDAVLFFSPSAVHSFFSVNVWKESMVAVAIGQTTADAIRFFGACNILLAPQPNFLSMLHSLETHFVIAT